MSAPTLLVTGASGHLGRAVVRHLLDTLNIDPARVIEGDIDDSPGAAQFGDALARALRRSQPAAVAALRGVPS